MAETEAGITEFRITLGDHERRQSQLSGIQQLTKDSIHQSADLSDVYYAPSAAYAELEASWSAAQGTLSVVKRSLRTRLRCFTAHVREAL